MIGGCIQYAFLVLVQVQLVWGRYGHSGQEQAGCVLPRHASVRKTCISRTRWLMTSPERASLLDASIVIYLSASGIADKMIVPRIPLLASDHHLDP